MLPSTYSIIAAQAGIFLEKLNYCIQKFFQQFLPNFKFKQIIPVNCFSRKLKHSFDFSDGYPVTPCNVMTLSFVTRDKQIKLSS